MGISVDVITPHLKKQRHEFCANISHGRMASALGYLDALLNIANEDSEEWIDYPYATVRALWPSPSYGPENGGTLDWMTAGFEAPRLRKFAFIAKVYDAPHAVVLEVLAAAATFAAANQGTVKFG